MLQVITGRAVKPRKIVVYGVGGIGKNTWASGGPKPLVIQTEDGSNDIGIDRLPMCLILGDLQQQLRSVLLEDHDYRTLIIDALDGVEALIHSAVVSGTNLMTVGEIGYGRGYEAAVIDMRKILFVLDKIRDVRGMTVICLAHAKIARFEDPANEAYDRYSMQLHHKAAAEVMHWADEVLFANYKTFVRKTEQGFRERNVAVGTGERFLFTREMPAYFAKSRLPLPAELPMPAPGETPTGWDIFAKYIGLPEREPEPQPSPAPLQEASQAAGTAAPVVSATEPDLGSSEPAGQVPAAQSTAPPPEIVAAAAACGMQVVDLDALDVDQLRELALPLAAKMSKRRQASMRAAIAKRDAQKMREIIHYTMTKPDTSALVDGEEDADE